MGSGGLEEGALMPILSLIISCPEQEETGALPLQLEDIFYPTTQQRKKNLLFPLHQPSQWDTITSSQWKASLLWIQFPPIDSLFQQFPFPLSFIKEHSPSLFSGLACDLRIALMSWIAILCYSWINPFLLIFKSHLSLEVQIECIQSTFKKQHVLKRIWILSFTTLAPSVQWIDSPEKARFSSQYLLLVP